MPCGSLLTSGQIGANGVVDVSGCLQQFACWSRPRPNLC